MSKEKDQAWQKCNKDHLIFFMPEGRVPIFEQSKAAGYGCQGQIRE
jgi:hypothetical protein